MRKIIFILVSLSLVFSSAVFLSACSSEPDPVDISSIAEIRTADGVSYAYAEADSAAAKDEAQLNDWYVNYYKDLRDNGDIVSLVVRYTDDPDHATLFSGINVYTGCEIDSEDNASFVTCEKWYHTESDRDRVLFEVEKK